MRCILLIRNSILVPFFAIILVAISVTAMSLALWTNNVRLNAVINTGEVNVGYEDIVLEEFEEAEGKDVGKCLYSIEASEGSDHLTITIYNGYPGYGCTVEFEIVNKGTIPVVGPFYNVTEIPYGIEVFFNSSAIKQLHPGDSAQYEITAKVLQTAHENSTYTIGIDITYIQWNEVYSYISGFVWNDMNNNRAWDPGENPVEGVNLLLELDGVILASTYTNIDGYYLFTIFPGTYVIRIIIPSGYTNTTVQTIVKSVGAGESSVNNNFGIMKLHTPPTPPALDVKGEFRDTDVNFEKCPAKLGLLLNEANVTISSGKVRSVSPGAFYHVLLISGPGLMNINITITYDYQFNIENGKYGKIRVYLLNATTKCIINELSNGFTYTIDNALNKAIVNITLPNPLQPGVTILIYSKFKPTEYDSVKEPHGLIGHDWSSLDKFFEVNHYVVTSIGSLSGSTIIQITKK